MECARNANLAIMGDTVTKFAIVPKESLVNDLEGTVSTVVLDTTTSNAISVVQQIVLNVKDIPATARFVSRDCGVISATKRPDV